MHILLPPLNSRRERKSEQRNEISTHISRPIAAQAEAIRVKLRRKAAIQFPFYQMVTPEEGSGDIRSWGSGGNRWPQRGAK